MKRSIILTMLALIAGFSVLQASDYRAGSEVIISEEQPGNVYAAGSQVTINAVINGDLIVAGGDITVNDSIRDDVIIAGGNITIMGVAGNDLRVFGGEITIAKDVYGDLVVTSGEVRIREGVTIWGDLVAAGGEIISNANVKGKVKIAGGELKLNGRLDGAIDAKAGDLYFNAVVGGPSVIATKNLSLGTEARFAENVRYWNGAGEVNFDGHLTNNATVEFDQSLKQEMDFEFNMKKVAWTITMFRIVSGIVLVSLLILLFGGFFERNAGEVRARMGNYLGLGLLLFLGLPFASAVAFGTVIGIPLGVIGIALFVILLIMANSLTAVVAAYEVKKARKENWNTALLIGIAILLFAALRLLDMVPVAGSLVNFALAAIAVGYVIRNARKKKEDGMEGPAEDIV